MAYAFSAAFVAVEKALAVYWIPTHAKAQLAQVDTVGMTFLVVNTEDSGTADIRGRDIRIASGMYPHLVDKQHHSVHKPAGKETAD